MASAVCEAGLDDSLSPLPIWWHPYTACHDAFASDEELFASLGGKNSNLIRLHDTMRRRGIAVPPATALSTALYHEFVQHNSLDERMEALRAHVRASLDDPSAWQEEAQQLRDAFCAGQWPAATERQLTDLISEQLHEWGADALVAVRSSATAEDLPQASFAGQQDTYLMLRGTPAVRDAIIRCYASLWNDRAVQYRESVLPGAPLSALGMSIALMRMVRSDLGSSGVAFSLDTETGYRDAVIINGSWGLGEAVVQGNVVPDEWIFQKRLLAEGAGTGCLQLRIGDKAVACRYRQELASDDLDRIELVEVPQEQRRIASLSEKHVQQLASWVVALEEELSAERGQPTPVDVEWAWEPAGPVSTESEGRLYVVQVRPETVCSQESSGKLETYGWAAGSKPTENAKWFDGVAVGKKIASGPLVLVDSVQELKSGRVELPTGSILVTGMTDPDWEPWMRRCAAMITDQGGRTCHAAIIARELGVPALVGTLEGTQHVRNAIQGADASLHATVDCSGGETGTVWRGAWQAEVQSVDLSTVPSPETWDVGLWLNVGSPELAFREAQLPAGGVGLARLEFIISQWIGVHPGLLEMYDSEREKLSDEELGRLFRLLRPGETGRGFYVRRLAEGMARIAGAFYPREVIARFSDFKSNEYRGLLGGERFEPLEENPMIGWRGASRYTTEPFDRWFLWECEAVRVVRERIGCRNLAMMIPFCRTVSECDRVLEQMDAGGIARGREGLRLYLMCEIPSNVILAEQFLQRVDGYSIGSNDLTQLTLGLDRDEARVAHLYDERNPAVMESLAAVIVSARGLGKKIGICGQAPSDFPEFAEFLRNQGIHTISVVSESFWRTALRLFGESK